MSPSPISSSAKKGNEKPGELLKFFMGGFPGCIAKVAIAPLDRVKILLQVKNPDYPKAGYFNEGIRQMFRSVYRLEGVRGFYKGNLAQLVRVYPYSGCQFYAYEKFKVSDQHLKFRGIFHCLSHAYKTDGIRYGLYRGVVPSLVGMVPYAGASFFTFEKSKVFLLAYFPQFIAPDPSDVSSGRVNLLGKTLSGLVGGIIGQSCAYPVDVVRRKMQVTCLLSKNRQLRNRTMMSTLVSTYQRHGLIHGLFRGFSLNFWRVPIMQCISFVMYELQKEFVQAHYDKKNAKVDEFKS